MSLLPYKEGVVDGSESLLINLNTQKAISFELLESELTGDIEKAAYAAFKELLPQIGDTVDWIDVREKAYPHEAIIKNDERKKKWVKNRVYAMNRKAGTSVLRWTRGMITRLR